MGRVETAATGSGGAHWPAGRADHDPPPRGSRRRARTRSTLRAVAKTAVTRAPPFFCISARLRLISKSVPAPFSLRWTISAALRGLARLGERTRRPPRQGRIRLDLLRRPGDRRGGHVRRVGRGGERATSVPEPRGRPRSPPEACCTRAPARRSPARADRPASARADGAAPSWRSPRHVRDVDDGGEADGRRAASPSARGGKIESQSARRAAPPMRTSSGELLRCPSPGDEGVQVLVGRLGHGLTADLSTTARTSSPRRLTMKSVAASMAPSPAIPAQGGAHDHHRAGIVLTISGWRRCRTCRASRCPW